ncbi:branched-chain amino acid aminotransferase [Terrimicrobium sacchariphilum]|uniref:Branched-chain-amino-acid aminotransferase n=1 Tax=Terrimicrobium sacchariphilum TaxID=690879 RepID=A0A146G946_TERSA|nr:branched-chain-amino-acid transaminase [Terrimicrobium sacchariphilum]GAT33991.1 branched-chain amino acid aminotransferase [Terrimicrobium sacchariphilum]
MKIFLDGQFYDKQDAKISVFDHGLLYGDGVFEGIRFYNGRVFRLEEHIDRLYDSAKAICLTIPMTPAEMTEALLETIRINELKDGYVRLVVTRGVGDLGLNPLLCPKASVFIIAAKITLYPEEMYKNGLTVVTCATRRIPHGALSPMVKSLNYLNNVLAKIEAQQAGAGEGLMLNEQGYVAECTGDNIFTIKNGQVYTPPISAGALAGVTREAMFHIAAQLGVTISEPNMTRYDIYTADECFLTGTAAEVIPVTKLDTRVIGTGKPGPLTLQFIEKFHELTANSGTAIY